jgi:hypothetical protein
MARASCRSCRSTCARRYDDDDNFAFASDALERHKQRGEFDEEFAVASPSAAAMLARAQERGRPEARAERRAKRQQLEAEAEKWAPGSAAMLALAQGFLNPDETRTHASRRPSRPRASRVVCRRASAVQLAMC